jgi:hypothetical protein
MKRSTLNKVGLFLVALIVTIVAVVSLRADSARTVTLFNRIVSSKSDTLKVTDTTKYYSAWQSVPVGKVYTFTLRSLLDPAASAGQRDPVCTWLCVDTKTGIDSTNKWTTACSLKVWTDGNSAPDTVTGVITKDIAIAADSAMVKLIGDYARVRVWIVDSLPLRAANTPRQSSHSLVAYMTVRF